MFEQREYFNFLCESTRSFVKPVITHINVYCKHYKVL